jgi:hypothetical protein
MRHLSLWSKYVEALAPKKPKNTNRHKFNLKRSFKMTSNAFKACVDILVSPKEGFDTVKGKKHWAWCPFTLIIACSAGMFLYYFSVVDFDWLVDQILSQGDLSEAELEASAGFMSQTRMTWSTTLGGVIGLIVANAIMAVYFNLVTNVLQPSEVSFTGWYGFSWWISMPLVVSSSLGILVILFSSSGLVSMEDLAPAGLGFLVDKSHSWFSLWNSITVFSLWSVYLCTVGLKSWLAIDANRALYVAVAPSVIIYGIWSLYIIMQT